MENLNEERGRVRTILIWTARILAVIVLLAVVVFGIVFRKPLYNRFVQFPKQQKAWEEIRAKRTAPPIRCDWTDYRGVMHSHSELSHDSDVAPEFILNVLKECDLDFIFLSDHYGEQGEADYSKQWHGLHDGKLFVPGFEMEGGFMAWGMPYETVFHNKDDLRENAKKIEAAGGMLFFCHCEEERLWTLPELKGMEIYNIHVDAKAADRKKVLSDAIFSAGVYPDQLFRMLFRRPTDFLERLDTLNKSSKVIPYGGNDSHQNIGLRFIYTTNDSLLIKETGGDDPKFDLKEIKLNALTRLAVRMMFGKLEPGKQLYRLELDPYNVSARFVNTHILAHRLTEADMMEALKAGRVYVAFDMISDARGFVWQAKGAQGKAIGGESITFEPGLKLQAAAPNECRFTVIRDGEQVTQTVGQLLDFEAPGPGKYRVEAELNILGEWTPWIYSNYLEVTDGSAPGAAPAGAAPAVAAIP